MTSDPRFLSLRHTVPSAILPGYQEGQASHWADLLAKTSPQKIWTAKQLVPLTITPRFPSLLGASDPPSINRALLDHFFPRKEPLPPRGHLTWALTSLVLTQLLIVPVLTSTHHFRHRRSRAQATFSLVKRHSFSGAGARLFLCHYIALGLLAILT